MASAMKYEQWDKHTTKLQNSYGYKGESPRILANVSTYDFVNDWLRPEVSWKILAFTLKCPHSAVEMRKVKGNLKDAAERRNWLWMAERIWATPGERIRGDYNEDIKPWHYAVYDDCQYVYTNNILRDLWRLHLTANDVSPLDDPALPNQTHQIHPSTRYLVNKKEIGEMLKNLSVNGRTKLLKDAGAKPADYRNTLAQEQWKEVSSIHYIEFFHPYHMMWLPPLGRRELAHALMRAD